jgi:exonuclease VII small subunit
MTSLPSRNSLQELQEWIRFRLELIENMSNELSIEKQSLNQLYGYKNQLMEISDEIKHEREHSLKFVRNSIDNEIKQGFYDLHVSEECMQMEREWSRLKQKLNSDLERLDIHLNRCAEFEKSIEPMQKWVDVQTQRELENIMPQENSDINEVKCLNTIEDDKHTMKQIAMFLESLEKLEIIWKSQDKSDKTVIGQIVQKHAEFIFDDLKQKMEKIELITKLKIESNLSQLKQNFALKMNEVNGHLETEVNFLNHGKIASLKQYENSINSIKEIQSKLSEARSQMQALLIKFETELKSNNASIDFESMTSSGASSARGPIKNLLNIVKNKINSYDLSGLLENNDANNKKSTNILSNLSNKHLESAAQNLVNQAEKEILPIWIKYDALLENMQSRIGIYYFFIMESNI